MRGLGLGLGLVLMMGQLGSGATPVPEVPEVPVAVTDTPVATPSPTQPCSGAHGAGLSDSSGPHAPSACIKWPGGHRCFHRRRRGLPDQRG